jgi:DNA mismatch repair protein MSH4
VALIVQKPEVECVPNDYFSDHDAHFMIVTGCNMSGKSIYIRGAAMLQIMA